MSLRILIRVIIRTFILILLPSLSLSLPVWPVFAGDNCAGEFSQISEKNSTHSIELIESSLNDFVENLQDEQFRESVLQKAATGDSLIKILAGHANIETNQLAQITAMLNDKNILSERTYMSRLLQRAKNQGLWPAKNTSPFSVFAQSELTTEFSEQLTRLKKTVPEGKHKSLRKELITLIMEMGLHAIVGKKTQSNSAKLTAMQQKITEQSRKLYEVAESEFANAGYKTASDLQKALQSDVVQRIEVMNQSLVRDMRRIWTPEEINQALNDFSKDELSRLVQVETVYRSIVRKLSQNGDYRRALLSKPNNLENLGPMGGGQDKVITFAKPICEGCPDEFIIGLSTRKHSFRHFAFEGENLFEESVVANFTHKRKMTTVSRGIAPDDIFTLLGRQEEWDSAFTVNDIVPELGRVSFDLRIEHYNHKDNIYRIVVCNAAKCNDGDGNQFRRGELITIYPKCGPGVFKVPRRAIIKRLRAEGKGLHEIIEFLPCE